MTKKKPEPNPIEKAIGDRTSPVAKQIMSQTQEEPSPQEMLSLEELNRQTEERLQNDPEEGIQMTTATHPIPKVPIIPVSKPDPQPVTKISSEESPPQKIEFEGDFSIAAPICPYCKEEMNASLKGEIHKCDGRTLLVTLITKSAEEIDEYQDAVKSPALGTPEEQDNEAQRQDSAPLDNHKFGTEKLAEYSEKNYPTEDVELTALRKYILEDGFVVATVAFHIVSLCAQPMTTPSTTMWDFKDRAMIPEMVLALLNQPGYLEGIWPSLKIVMSSNVGNAAWSSGIATTIAFFDVIRTLPAIKELQNENKNK